MLLTSAIQNTKSYPLCEYECEILILVLIQIVFTLTEGGLNPSAVLGVNMKDRKSLSFRLFKNNVATIVLQ